MNTKNVVIATIVSLSVVTSTLINPTKVGSNEVAEIPVVSADVPLTTEIPFLYSHKIVPLTISVQKEANSTKEVEQPEAIKVEPVNKKDDFKKYDLPMSEDLQRFVWDLSKKYDIQYELILSIIANESNFDANAVSYDDSSMGLMQVNIRDTFYGAAKELEISNPKYFNPYHNVHVGIYVLSQRIKYREDRGMSGNGAVNAAILSYRYGNGGANSRMKNNTPLNYKYVKNVLLFRDNLIKGDYIEQN